MHAFVAQSCLLHVCLQLTLCSLPGCIGCPALLLLLLLTMPADHAC